MKTKIIKTKLEARLDLNFGDISKVQKGKVGTETDLLSLNKREDTESLSWSWWRDSTDHWGPHTARVSYTRPEP